jgi:hypothetical protein
MLQKIFRKKKKLQKKFIQDLKYAACFGKPGVFNYWINQGIDVNYQDSKGRTPLFFCYSFINELLQYGANVHILDVENNNCLMYIMKNCCHVDYKPIVEQGIDLFHKNIKNQSVFDCIINYMKTFDDTEEFIEIKYFKEAFSYFEKKGKEVLKNLLKKYLFEELIEIILFFVSF